MESLCISVGFLSGACWRVGAGRSGGEGFLLGYALGWAGRGHLGLHRSVGVAFGASDWLCLGVRLGVGLLSSGFSWSFHAPMCVGWGLVVCLGLVSSFRSFSKFVFWIINFQT